MKIYFFALLVFASALQVAAQHNEWSVQIPSGIFSFGGSGSTSSSFYLVSNLPLAPNYTNNPYGTGSAYSYGLVVNFQRITKAKIIFGLQTGFESFSSKLKVDNVYVLGIPIPVKEGKTILTNQFINFHPFVGQRLKIFQGLDTDITFGFDFAPCLHSTEHATIKTLTGIQYNTTLERHIPSPDLRTRIEMINYYKKIGLSLGYSYGLTNYTNDFIGQSSRVYSRLVRIGVAYRF